MSDFARNAALVKEINAQRKIDEANIIIKPMISPSPCVNCKYVAQPRNGSFCTGCWEDESYNKLTTQRSI